MNIEPLDCQTIKITLSNKDMQKYSITYDKMDYNDKTTRQAIIKLLYKVRDDIHIDISKNKIFIEAFPTEEDGCIFYLNLLGENEKEETQKNNFDTPLITEVKDIEALTSLCKNMLSRCCHLILKSNLYHHKNKFVLTVYSYYKQDDKLSALLSEHGTLIGRGELDNSLICEHSNLIVKNKAIETVTNCLSSY